MPLPTPSQEYLQECFYYNPTTGALSWRDRPVSHFKNEREAIGWNKRFAGAGTDTLSSNGYKRVYVGGVGYYVHRIIWKLVTGNEAVEMDHRDRSPSNNAWDNLRDGSHRQNISNIKLNKRNTSGMKGVSARCGRFRAHIRTGGKSVSLGTFDTAEQAHAAYCAAAREAFGEFWNPG